MTEAEATPAEEPATAAPEEGKKETTAAYWKRQLKKHPALIWELGANKKLEKIWLADHPGETAVPKNIIQNLANVKSVLRNQLRAKGAGPKGKKAEPVNGAPVKAAVRPHVYEALESQVDECLARAREADKDGLEKVIQHLRAARNLLIHLQKP